MSISEYVECEADTDAAVRFAGSIDCGAVDTEHTHLYVAAAHVASPLGDVVADHETRIVHLERIVHRLLNAAETEPPAAAPDPFAPDWSTAPEWAQWHAVDADGARAWFDGVPHPDGARWSLFLTSRPPTKMRTIVPNWRDSLRRRPEARP